MPRRIFRSLMAVCILLSGFTSAALAGDDYDMASAVEKALRDNQGVVSSGAARDAAEEGRKSARQPSNQFCKVAVLDFRPIFS